MKRLLVQRGTNHAVAAAAAAATMAAVAACLPQVAFAAENAQVVEGVMTITLQETPAVATAPVTAASTPAATTTAAEASSAPVTGDPVLWLIAGAIALLVAAVFVFMRMRAAQTTSPVAPSVAHAKHTDGCGNAFSAKSALAAMVAALLAACLCFGMYFAKSTAFAEGLLSGVTATSSITVDERGNVVSSDIAIANASGEGIILAKVTAPSELSGWSANIETDQVIKAAEQATGEWDGKTIPAAVLSKLKENGGTLELRFEVSVTSTNLDFEEISVNATDAIYDGTQIKPAVASDEYVEGVDYEVTYGENVDAGMGTVTVTGKGNYTGQKTYEFKIAPATLTVTTPSAQKQYDGAALTSAGSIEGFVNGETAEFAVTGSQAGVGSSSNSYAISWNGTAKQANYTISEAVGTLEVTANTAKIDVTAGSAEKTYDGSALTSSEVTVTGLPEGFTCSATTAGSQTDAGTSANTVTEFAILDPDGKNVTEYFANIEKHAGTLKIKKRTVVLASSDATKVYDGSALTNEEVKVAEGSFAGKEFFSASVTGAITNAGSVKNAFTYELVNGAKAENYEVKTIEGELSVTPQSISDKMVGVSADGTTYMGGQLTPEVHISGLTKGSDYSVSYGENVNAGEGAGSITIQGVGNYTDALTWHFDIQPREVEFEWSNLSFAYDGRPHVPTAKVANAVAGETVTATVDGAQTNAGSYTATATALSSANYTLPAGGAATAEFVVVPREVTVSGIAVADSVCVAGDAVAVVGKIYDGTRSVTLDTDAANISGKVDGDDLTVSAIGEFKDKNAGENKKVAIFDLKLQGGSAANYALAAQGQQTDAVATILKRQIRARYNDAVSVVDKVYDGTTKAELSGAAVLEGIVAGEDLGVTQDANFDFPSAGSCMVYVSNVQLTGATAENYEIQNVVAGRLVGNILPIEAELEWDGLSVTYDGQPHAPTAKVANAVAGETVTATVDGAQTNAGSYTATATGLSDTNYLLPAYAATAEFTIKKANPTPSATLQDSYTIAVGDKLQTIDLPTCTNGTYTWETPTKTYSEGTHQASVIFTPNDQGNYNVLAFTVSVTEKQKTAFAVYSADDNSLYLYKRATVPSEGSTFEGKKVTKTYTGIESDHSRPFDGCQNLVESVKVVDEGIKPMQTSYWFQGFSKVTSIDLTGLDTSSVTEMWSMFDACRELEILTLSDSFDTSKVVSMGSMFNCCFSLASLDLPDSFDTSKVVSMESMFNGCISLASLDLPDSFDTSSVAHMYCMFAYCHSLQLDCSKWKVSTSCEHTDFNYLAYGVIEPNWE